MRDALINIGVGLGFVVFVLLLMSNVYTFTATLVICALSILGAIGWYLRER